MKNKFLFLSCTVVFGYVFFVQGTEESCSKDKLKEVIKRANIDDEAPVYKIESAQLIERPYRGYEPVFILSKNPKHASYVAK